MKIDGNTKKLYGFERGQNTDANSEIENHALRAPVSATDAGCFVAKPIEVLHQNQQIR